MSSLPYCLETGNSTFWASRRRPTRATDLALIIDAQRWLATLPDDAQVSNLAARFPRIVNNIVARLQHPQELADYMDDLLVDRRGNRTGFPMAVMTDLIRLNSHFLKTRRYPALAPTFEHRPHATIPSRERTIAPETLRRDRAPASSARRRPARPSLLMRLKHALHF